MLKADTKCLTLDIFVKRFLRSNVRIKNSKNVKELYDFWALFFENYIRLYWPQESQKYNSYLSSVNMCLGFEYSAQTEMATAIEMFSFPDCVDCLTRKNKDTNKAYCTLIRENNREGFVLIGNVLWNTDETGIQWN